MHKTAMRVSVIESRVNSQQLHDNIGDLASYMVSCNSNIESIHQSFDAKFSALIV